MDTQFQEGVPPLFLCLWTKQKTAQMVKDSFAYTAVELGNAVTKPCNNKRRAPEVTPK